MSTDSHSVSPFRIPPPWKRKNIMWLDTFHFAIEPDLRILRPGQSCDTEPKAIRLIEEMLSFNIVPTSINDLAIYCFRHHPNPTVLRDTGYSLLFHISIIGFADQPSKSIEMYGGSDAVFVMFKMHSIQRIIDLNYERYMYELKVVVNLIEYENLPGTFYDLQENALSMAKERFFDDEKVQDLGYLLKRPGVVDVFTGRFHNSFTQLKMCLIVRASVYSKEIAEYFRAKERGDQVLPDVNFSEILGFIANHEMVPITDETLVTAYLAAYTTGMEFLKEFIRDYMRKKLDEKSFLTDVVVVADNVEDQPLFEDTGKEFLNYFLELLCSDKFRRVKETTA